MVFSKKNKLSTKPEKPPPPELIGRKGSALTRELRKDKFFSKLKNTPQKERENMGNILADKSVFGNYIRRENSSKVESLESELRRAGSSSDPRIKKIGRTIRDKYGRQRAGILADIVREKYLGKK